jgi:flagellar hook-associated protein 1 FlgK
MTTLNNIVSIATSGLYAAQTGITATSENVTNVNTTGYVRQVLNQTPANTGGAASGVDVSGVNLAINRFLENTSYSASASVGQSQAVSNLLGQAQSLLGDPSSSSGFFNQFSNVLSAFSAAANDPTSNLSASDAVSAVSQFITQAQSTAGSINQLSSQADTNIESDVTQINQLLGQISSLNGSIASASAGGGNVTDAQNAQNALVTQLSSLVDVKIASTQNGGVSLTTTSGQTLVGQYGAATLAYSPSASAASQVTITPPGVSGQSNTLQLQSGELQGLLSLRNTLLPGVQDQLTEYVTQAVNALNQASNASSTAPAPNTLTGQPVTTDLTTALTGFTGKTNIAVVNSSGVVQQQVTVDFSAGTITPAGGTAFSFSPSTFITSLNAALGGAATVSETSNNALSIKASGTNGVAIADDATTPSSKSGEGFSQYFGLNNLITTTGVTNYQTGLTTSSPSGFAGGSITLRLSNSAGDPIADVPVTIPSGGTVGDVLNALNSNSGGVGLYGQFSLDSTGTLSFTPNSPGAVSTSVVSDSTEWGSSGNSFSQLFGLSDASRANRINDFSVNAAISANPSKTPFAQLNLSVAAGQSALAPADGSGAQALANAGSTTLSFAAAGGLGAEQSSVNQYGANLAGLLGSQTSAANTAVTNAQAVQTEAQSRQQSVEGVNLDQELVNLTTYQQAYSASSRLITATNDMFTALMNM